MSSYKTGDAFQTISLGASANGKWMNVGDSVNCSFFIVVANTNAAGKFTIEGGVSDDVNADAAPLPMIDTTTQSSVDGLTIASGTASYKEVIGVVDCPTPWVRIKWTRTSGSGTANITFTRKRTK